MPRSALRLFYLSQVPPGPPRYGGQVRMHGLMSALGRRHSITSLAIAGPDVDRAAAQEAMLAYCREVVLVPGRPAADGARKRLLQARSLFSPFSFERHLYRASDLQATIDRLLSRERFDLVNVEFPYLAHHRLRTAPPRAPPPRLVLDEHNVEYDVLRQVAGSEAGAGRRIYNLVNWRKLRREEQLAWRRFDGIAVSSAPDEQTVRAVVPEARIAVVPNAVDLQRFSPVAARNSDARTLLFFGAVGYFPNTDGVLWFLREIWPAIAQAHPRARVKIVGLKPPPAVLALAGPRVEVTGFVDDVRPHISEAAVVVVPLRIGSGTRLKILEAMAMGKAIVSTSIGAAGLEVTAGKELIIADEPQEFAAETGRLLTEPRLAETIGAAARYRTVERYSWDAAAARLETFFDEVLSAR